MSLQEPGQSDPPRLVGAGPLPTLGRCQLSVAHSVAQRRIVFVSSVGYESSMGSHLYGEETGRTARR